MKHSLNQALFTHKNDDKSLLNFNSTSSCQIIKNDIYNQIINRF